MHIFVTASRLRAEVILIKFDEETVSDTRLHYTAGKFATLTRKSIKVFFF